MQFIEIEPMSEEKIIKHSENAVHIIGNKKLSWKKKIKELAEEIAIIVFAVSITLAFHNWNDERHERKMEKEFLLGIKEDLKGERENLEASIKFFQPTIDYYNNVWKQINGNKIDAAYIDSNSGYLINTNYYVPDNGRFEGFKSSGYLRLIENKELLKHLTTLYTISMPFEQDADKNVFRTREQDYNMYIGTKTIKDSLGMHVSKLINDPAVRYQVYRYTYYFDERKNHKQDLADQINKVITEIDKELNN